MSQELIQLMLLFFIIAVIYSSAGFGGGSSYIALLTLYPMSFTSLRILALLCNIVVVTGTIYILHRHGFIRWKKIIPIILLSIPFAYLGGRFNIEERTFYIILALALLIASIIMLLKKPREEIVENDKPQYFLNSIMGGGIGLLSGIVGIGGGIFLAPILHTTHWATVKVIAGTTAVFILVNSIAGLAGQVYTNGFTVDYFQAIALMVSVFIGGQLGIRLTVKFLSPIVIRRITAILIMIVSLRLIYLHLLV